MLQPKIEKEVSQVALQQDKTLVSVDVKNLYTSVPIDESIAQSSNLKYQRKTLYFDRKLSTGSRVLL